MKKLQYYWPFISCLIYCIWVVISKNTIAIILIATLLLRYIYDECLTKAILADKKAIVEVDGEQLEIDLSKADPVQTAIDFIESQR